jgi:hypothetical protein
MPNDHSLAHGIFKITSLLAAVALGGPIPAITKTLSHDTMHKSFSQTINNEHYRARLSTSASSVCLSPPKTQHKRTASSPTNDKQVLSHVTSPIQYRARPRNSPVRPISLLFEAINSSSPSSPSSPSLHSVHTSQSDSQLNSNYQNFTMRMASTPEENGETADYTRDCESSSSKIPTVNSTYLMNLSKSAEQLHVPSLLDIESEAQQ